MEPLTASLEPDALIQGRYLVRRTVGRGGMGAVYEAIDQRLGHTVALKQMLVGGDSATAAFEREARILAGLRHPGLPRVTDFFGDPRGLFLVMEFIPGGDLGALLTERGRPFPVEDVVRWADQILDVLTFLHGQQPPILHRDIKPQNIKLTPAGDVVLLDFGLAKGLGPAQATSTASLFGYTPNYAPLEQVQGAGTTPASDLYALAATLHHLLAGEPPPDVLQRGAAVASSQPDPLRPVHALNPLVPPALGQLILHGLQLDQARRPASAAAMRAALRQLQTRPVAPPDPARLGTTVPAAPPRAPEAPTLPPAPPAARRDAMPLIAGGLLALVVLLGAVLAVVVSRNNERERLAEAYAQTVIALAGASAPTAEVAPEPPTTPLAEQAGPTTTADQERAPTVAQATVVLSGAQAPAFGPPGPQAPRGARASDESPPSVDSAGNQVTFNAVNAIDGRADTAWRVEGAGVGEYIEVQLAGPVRVREVQIIPGYAKVDPATGTDRFRQNRRVLRANIEFDDGTVYQATFEQRPELQAVRLPEPVVTTVVRVVVVESSEPAPAPEGRDFTPISEIVVIGEPRLP